jgi:PAS domain S-box-containing protein
MSPYHRNPRDARYYLDLIDVVQDGIICTDADARIVLLNRTAVVMLGYPPEQLLDAPFETIYVVEDRSRCCPRIIQETLERGSYQGEFLFQRRDGSRFPGHLSSSRLRPGGKSGDIVFLLHDLTQEKRLQRRLLESQKMAYLGRLVEGISHEIRNPIVTLGGYARRLKRMLESDHPGQKYLDVILEDVQRMEAMLKDVENYVAFTKYRRPSFHRVDLQGVLMEAMQELQVPPGISLKLELPNRGPWIFGDPPSLQELFLCLLENAVEAMPRGGVLRVGLTQESGEARVIVQDSGIGIREEDLPFIFNPFFTTKTQGAGMGLARAYLVAEEHAGQIEVQSTPGEGTTFTVTFPLDRRQWVRRDESG